MTAVSVRPRRGLRFAGTWGERWPGLWVVAAAVLTLIVAATLLAPLIAPYDPQSVDLSNILSGPSSAHLLGTDAVGRDLLSRLLWGGRTALLAPALIIAIAGVIGVTLAMLAAWSGGWVDFAISRLFDVVFAFPGLLLAILATAVFGPSLTTMAVALAIAYVPYVGRVTRSEAVRQRHLPYMAAATLQGGRALNVALRHLVPNVAPIIVAQLTLAYGYALLDAATLSYLGLGIQPPTADWGLMVSEGQPGLTGGHAAESLLAGGMIVLVVVAVTLVGSHLADRAERVT